MVKEILEVMTLRKIYKHQANSKSKEITIEIRKQLRQGIESCIRNLQVNVDEITVKDYHFCHNFRSLYTYYQLRIHPIQSYLICPAYVIFCDNTNK